MRIVSDQGTPVPLRRHIRPHEIDTANELGWSRLENGELLAAAESSNYDCLITTDQNLRYQQNLSGRLIRILVLQSTSWPRIQKEAAEIVMALEDLEAGGYVEIAI